MIWITIRNAYLFGASQYNLSLIEANMNGYTKIPSFWLHSRPVLEANCLPLR